MRSLFLFSSSRAQACKMGLLRSAIRQVGASPRPGGRNGCAGSLVTWCGPLAGDWQFTPCAIQPTPFDEKSRISVSSLAAPCARAVPSDTAVQSSPISTPARIFWCLRFNTKRDIEVSFRVWLQNVRLFRFGFTRACRAVNWATIPEGVECERKGHVVGSVDHRARNSLLHHDASNVSAVHDRATV